MGQAISSIPHANASDDQAGAQQPAGSSSSATNAQQGGGGRRTDNTGGSSGGPRRRRTAATRYSPYANPVASTTQSARQTLLSQSIGVQGGDDEEMARMRRNAAQLVDEVLPIADDLSAPRFLRETVVQTAHAETQDDVEMTNTEGRADAQAQNASSEEPNQPLASLSSSPRRQNNTQGGGDVLLARIIGRSIVDAVARELEERGTALAAIHSAQGMEAFQGTGNAANSTNFFSAPSPAPASNDSAGAADPAQQQQVDAQGSVIPAYSMRFSGRVALYRDVARFILSIIVSELGSAPNSNTANSGDRVQPNFESSIPLHIQTGSMATSTTNPSSGSIGNRPSGNAAQENTLPTSDTSSETTQQSTQQTTQQSSQQHVEELMRHTRMHYRMFLLPDAIDQTLEHYERYRRDREQSTRAPTSSGDSANANDGAGINNGQADNAPIIESLNSVIDRIGSETRQASDPTSSGQAEATTSSNPASATQPSRTELLRIMRQREREAKLRRLRSMVQAMSDERRYLPVPVVILGMHMSGELHQAIRTEFSVRGRDTASRAEAGGSTSSTSASGTSSTDNAHANVASASATGHEDSGGEIDGEEHGIRGIFSAIRTGVGRILPIIVDGLAAWRHGRSDLGTTAPGNAEGGGLDNGASDPSVESLAEALAAANNNANNNAPMMSAYLTIQYTQLGNPLLLHIIASTLLSDMLGETDASQNSSASGNDYEILTELSNIIGQVISNTVSQDLINKKLAKYRYEGIVGGETEDGEQNTDAIARLIEDEKAEKDGKHPSTVKLLSSHRCPVCLDDFKVGETLRVLGCRHALHLLCGDSWFTQGSNMCPVCRAEAVNTAAN
ncbi:hypothetical protein GGI23_000958 [Coemansia sp. RSA 2559]|nr:hypothetical protein GGI23_000958 [Coemansia sp. RSA 2559]KAJ2866354.1 hypothetical protein GGI22_001301 [Coemansia erecta]